MQRCISGGISAVCLLTVLTGCGTLPITPVSVIHPDSADFFPADTGTPVSVQPDATETTPDEHPFRNRTYGATDCVVIQNVPHYLQFDSYFTACESIAACELLEYCGISMTLDTFLDEYLPRTDYPQRGADGLLHGESAWKAFAGDPRLPDGFGCYNTAIETAVNRIRPGLAVAAQDIPLETLCAEHIAKGEPVIIWATINMSPAYVGFEWVTPEGGTFQFIVPEHALLLIGYDPDYYYFSDSLQYDSVYKYARSAVETAYEALGRQSLYLDMKVLAEVPDFWRIPEPSEERSSPE